MIYKYEEEQHSIFINESGFNFRGCARPSARIARADGSATSVGKGMRSLRRQFERSLPVPGMLELQRKWFGGNTLPER